MKTTNMSTSGARLKRFRNRLRISRNLGMIEFTWYLVPDFQSYFALRYNSMFRGMMDGY